MSTSLVPVKGPTDALEETNAVLSLPPLRLLRLSVTDLCNFRCCYCMPRNGVPKIKHDEVLPLESLSRLVSWLVSHVGIRRVRLTGGEPLVRPAIEHLIADLSQLEAIQEISMTTNGSTLSRRAWALKAAGLNRVNISLDSLDEARFAEITRGGTLQSTLAGIKAADEAGLTPIKLNTVLRNSTWKTDVPRLLDYAANTGLEIRFIELMRMGTEQSWCESEFISVDDVCAGLGAEVLSAEKQPCGPARNTLVNWHGTLLRVGWIAPRSHPFCNRCERLRMDARGQIRRCLMDSKTHDLRSVLITNNDQTARQELQTYLEGKLPPLAMESHVPMNQIGG
ncbi:MAG TPA: GTP 3',8-cyclase MoaA [Candidatus Saccharimonadales bacterium]|nr:GTP 3',8-cyclase MoaA [Candidatus Saccharimonadales bacterium]